MKRFIFYVFISLTVVLSSSCYSGYQFVQVQEYSIKNGNSLTVENEDVKITYSVANLSDGWCSYTVYNKTNSFVYVDMSKSFTIDQNGLAHNIIHPYEFSPMTSKKTGLFTAQTKDSASYSVYHSADVIVIPPLAMKILYGFASGPGLMLHCNLPQYPIGSTSVKINKLVFTAVTTYKRDGDQGEKTIRSDITLDKVSNMPEYIIARYRKRPSICENMKESGKTYPSDNEQVYDLYYDISQCAIAFPYYVKSSYKKYYDYKPEYRWFEPLKGYIKIR